MLSTKQITLFQKEILEWFGRNKRDLPWRRFRDPYGILISEVMLQQTQVARVIPKFKAWMREFPTLTSLAKASTRDILMHWSGLGYNRRALYLQNLAKELVKNHNETFSQDEKELMKLPGIGKYTARAILCFAFNKQIAVVDTNVRKVILIRFKDQVTDVPEEIQKLADRLLPQGKAYEWNQALMDYSFAILKKEKIFLPKQTPFKTSARFYRGQVLKLLLKQNETSDALFNKIENNGITREEFIAILDRLVKDRLLKKKGERYVIPE